MTYTKGTPRVYGTGLFAMVEGKLHLVGSFTSVQKEVAAFEMWYKGALIKFPKLVLTK
jgi:hypothetical protein